MSSLLCRPRIQIVGHDMEGSNGMSTPDSVSGDARRVEYASAPVGFCAGQRICGAFRSALSNRLERRSIETRQNLVHPPDGMALVLMVLHLHARFLFAAIP